MNGIWESLSDQEACKPRSKGGYSLMKREGEVSPTDRRAGVQGGKARVGELQW